MTATEWASLLDWIEKRYGLTGVWADAAHISEPDAIYHDFAAYPFTLVHGAAMGLYNDGAKFLKPADLYAEVRRRAKADPERFYDLDLEEPCRHDRYGTDHQCVDHQCPTLLHEPGCPCWPAHWLYPNGHEPRPGYELQFCAGCRQPRWIPTDPVRHPLDQAADLI